MKRPSTAATLLLAFVVCQGLAWLGEEGSASLAPTTLSLAVAAFLAGALFMLWGYLQNGSPGTDGTRRSFWPTAQPIFATALWLSGPTLVYVSLRYRPGANARALSMGLVPAITSFLAHFREETSEGDLLAKLWPALAGLSGLLFLLPQPDPGFWRGWAALLLPPLVLGAAAVFAPRSWHGETRPAAIPFARRSPHAAGLGLLLSGLLLMVCRIGDPSARQVHSGAVLLQGFGISVSLFLLVRLGAARWSAIFFLSPLVAMIGSLLLLRPALDLRSFMGLLLLAIGGFYMLFRANSAIQTTLLLRDPTA